VEPLFINDCTPDVTYSHDGVTPRIFWDDSSWETPTSSGINAEVGCYVDFMSGDSLSGSYLGQLDDTSLTIVGDGDGALGFAVSSTSGELLAFTNHRVLTLTDDVATKLRYGAARVEAIVPWYGGIELPLTIQSGDTSPDGVVCYMSLSAALTKPRSTITLPVLLENSGDITAFQFDLRLPAGFSIPFTYEDGEMLYDITYNSDRAKRTHVIMVEPQPDGAFRVAGYSTANAAFAGNSGDLLYITLNVGDVPDGDYLVMLDNVRMVATDASEVVSSCGAYVTVRCAPQGDVNGDYSHTMSDVVMMVNAVLHRYQENFGSDVADMNGDGELSMGDVVRVLRLVLTGGRAMVPAAVPEAAVSAPVLSAGECAAMGDGRMVLPVMLEGDAVYSAFQFDVSLPAGVEFVEAALTARAKASHTIAWDRMPDGLIRIVAYSLDNAAFRSGEDPIVNLVLDISPVLSASASMHLAGGLFVTSEGDEHTCADVCVPMYVGSTRIIGASVPSYCAVGTDGAVKVTCCSATNISIHAASGKLVGHFVFEAGTHTVVLPQGVYVIGREKVVVR
jgi:hypothetical protein